MKPSKAKISSLLIILAGALIAGSGDLSFDLLSYSYVIANNLFTSAYLVAIKKLDKGPKLDAFAKVYYNSLLSIPFLLVIAFLNGEMERLSSFEYLHDQGFQLAFLFSCILAFGVNCATFWCTSATSPLTTSVTGQCKNILTTFLGMFIFGDVVINNTLVLGLLIGILGSIWFSYVETSKKLDIHRTKTEKVSIDSNGKDLEVPTLKENNGSSNNLGLLVRSSKSNTD
jgi:drug/metabolite transporter (DMT)-like permease